MKTVSILMMVCCASLTTAQDQLSKGKETQQDLPSSHHKYYGQRINSWKDGDRKIAKFDLDADLNLDGVISDEDPADGGAFESTPPGLMVGVGEMSRVILRLHPYRVDFDGEIVVSLEISGINRGDSSGDFETFEEQVANTGHVRVWGDASKTQLLLDSADPNKQFVEFTTQFREFPFNLQFTVPRAVYVEGVKAAPQYMGDIRLLGTVSHRAEGQDRTEVAPSGKSTLAKGVNVSPDVEPSRRDGGIKRFRTTFDHTLVTVLPQPARKSFVNNNVEGVWSGSGASNAK